MEAADKIASFNLMLAGFAIGTVDEAFKEIIVGSHPRGIVGFKAGQNSQKREGASLFDPVGDAGYSI